MAIGFMLASEMPCLLFFDPLAFHPDLPDNTWLPGGSHTCVREGSWATEL